MKKLLMALMVLAFVSVVTAQEPKSTLTAGNDLSSREGIDAYLKANTPAAVKTYPKIYSMCVLFYADTSVKPVERPHACRRKTDDGFELEFSKESIGAWDANIPQTRGALFVMKQVSKTCRKAMWLNDNELRYGGKHAAGHCDP